MNSGDMIRHCKQLHDIDKVLLDMLSDDSFPKYMKDYLHLMRKPLKNAVEEYTSELGKQVVEDVMRGDEEGLNSLRAELLTTKMGEA